MNKVQNIPSILQKGKSFHCYDTDGRMVAHTTLEQNVSEWADLYPNGEGVVEVAPALPVADGTFKGWKLSATAWFGHGGEFEMVVTDVSKEVALGMFIGAVQFCCANQ